MLTLREAAYRILAEAEGPLSIEEITQRAKERGLLSSTSRRPSASMAAALYVDVRRNPDSPFVQVDRGKFALKPGASARADDLVSTGYPGVKRQDISMQVEAHNRQVKEKLLTALKEMDPRAFEHLIARLLERIGYEGVQVTRYSGDGGIDIRATLAPGKVPISLVNGERLVELLVEKQIGVVARAVHVLDLDLDILQPPDQDNGNGGGNREKYRSVWPLPGGDYLAALNAMLEFVAAESPTLDEMTHWIKQTFPKVTSTNVATNYVRLLRSAGLIAFEGSRLVVTDEGAVYLREPTREYLLDLFTRRFVGIDALLEILHESPGPLDHVHRQLVDRLNVDWATPAQTKYRLEWLQALGAAAKGADGVWYATLPAKEPPGTPRPAGPAAG